MYQTVEAGLLSAQGSLVSDRQKPWTCQVRLADDCKKQLDASVVRKTAEFITRESKRALRRLHARLQYQAARTCMGSTPTCIEDCSRSCRLGGFAENIQRRLRPFPGERDLRLIGKCLPRGVGCGVSERAASSIGSDSSSEAESSKTCGRGGSKSSMSPTMGDPSIPLPCRPPLPA
jgi:hypothetical protein